MMVYIMKTISVFKTEEYEKMMEALGLFNTNNAEDETTDYFNAWHFGQSEEAGDFVLCTTTAM